MSHIVGRGRYARETYPTSGGTGGGGTGCPPAVVFDPNPPCTPTTNIRSARSANQSAITGTPVGATNLGSDTSGTSAGVSGDYATVGGGDQNVAAGVAATAPGGFLALALADFAVALGGEDVIASQIGAAAIGTEAFAVGELSVALNGGEAFGDESFAATTGIATGESSVAIGSGQTAGSGVFSFTIPAGGTLVTIAGDATADFQDTDPVAILPVTPKVTISPTGLTVASVPTFDGTNTTFNLSAPIDGTTTGGEIADTVLGTNSAAVGGAGNHTLGDASFIGGGTGNLTTATASSSRAGGILASPTRVTQDAWASGSDATTAGNIQTSQLVLSGRTPGTNPGESVELSIDFDNANLPLQLDNDKAYTFRLSVIATGRISGIRANQSFEVETTVSQDAGVITVSADTIVTQQGDAAAASWSVTGAAAGVGPTLRLAYTFNTGATTAVTVVAAQCRFTEVFGPTSPS